MPQGSILGPILFLLYINDIKNSSKILNFFLFADDTSTLLINKKVEEIEKIYNEELRHVSEWLNANKLSLNIGKSNLILFQKGQTKITYKPDIKIMGEHIKEKEFTKYLGVLIDKTLSWTYHINHVNLKISRGKAILTKLRHYVSKDTLCMLYFAFVQPNIDYGLIVWGSATPSALKPIQTNIKKQGKC